MKTRPSCVQATVVLQWAPSMASAALTSISWPSPVRRAWRRAASAAKATCSPAWNCAWWPGTRRGSRSGSPAIDQ